MTVTVFRNANIFDGVSPEPAEGMTVVVEGDVIKDVAATVTGLADADHVDCTGLTLMPGLIDNHVHIYFDSPNIYPPEPPMTYRAHYAAAFMRHMLSAGFTTLRDVGGGDLGMAMALEAGLLDGPRYFYGGYCLTQTGGHGDFRRRHQATDYCMCGPHRNMLAQHADGVDECVKTVREELRKGASHIKIMASGGVLSLTDPLERCQYSEAEIRAIVEECTRHGAYVAAHCHPAEAIRRCVAFGVRSIEHGTLIDAETARFVAGKGAFVVPTMAIIYALIDDPSQDIPSAAREKLKYVHGRTLEGLAHMKNAGVKMGFGTDLVGGIHTRQGLEFRVRSEVLSPFDILHSATAVNAELLQMEGHLGVVRPGALADLLVVEGNPLADIEVVAAGARYLRHIMAQGRFVKRAPN